MCVCRLHNKVRDGTGTDRRSNPAASRELRSQEEGNEPGHSRQGTNGEVSQYLLVVRLLLKNIAGKPKLVS